MNAKNPINFPNDLHHFQVKSIMELNADKKKGMQEKEPSCSYYYIVKDPIDEQILFIRPFIKFRDNEML